MPNIINTPDPDYLPVSPQKQLEYMIDFHREVINSGGIGTVFWEPAWVSTPCRTPWGQGSSHDHVVFFDPVNTNFMTHGGGRWTESQYYENTSSPKITFIVNIGEQNAENGVFLKGSWSDEFYSMMELEDNKFQFTVYELNEGDSVGYYFLTDTAENIRETIPAECALWESTDRTIVIGAEDMTVEMYWESCNDQPPVDQITNRFRDNLLVYSNPADEYLLIKLPVDHRQKLVRILDLNGKILIENTLRSHEQNIRIDISSLALGLYFLQIFDSKNLLHRKLFVI